MCATSRFMVVSEYVHECLTVNHTILLINYCVNSVEMTLVVLYTVGRLFCTNVHTAAILPYIAHLRQDICANDVIRGEIRRSHHKFLVLDQLYAR